MDIDWVRDLCLSLPGATEHEIWEGDLTFKVAGRIFAHTVLEVAPVWLSFKCSPEAFAELTERPHIVPAPYLARAKWVALETKDALPAGELEQLIRESYAMVIAKLPAKTRSALAQSAPPKKRPPKSHRSPSKKKKK